MLKNVTLLAISAVVTFVVHRESAIACSICRCGEPTFNAFGPNIYTAGQFRLAVDWDRFDKENGTSDKEMGMIATRRTASSARFSPRAADITGSDAEVENRVTATLSYSFGEHGTAVVRIPWSFRHLTSTTSAPGTPQRRSQTDCRTRKFTPS